MAKSLEHVATPPMIPPLGDHPALDFLNTAYIDGGERVETLPGGHAVIRWMQTARLLDDTDVEALGRLSERELHRLGQQARALREWLRSALAESAEAQAMELGPLQAALGLDDSFVQLGQDHGGTLTSDRRRRWRSHAPLMAVIAEQMVELLINEDMRYIRGCEASDCSLVFLDRTKAHRRRWCSMAMCGNRAKVAAHRVRGRARSSV